VLTIGLKETPSLWITEACKAVEALKPAIEVGGRYHQKKLKHVQRGTMFVLSQTLSKLKYSPCRVATMYNEQSLHQTVTLQKKEIVQGSQQNIQPYKRTVG
jgi:hypothetical protein